MEVKFEILPDFRIKKVAMDPRNPEVGETVEITVTIENIGNADWEMIGKLKEKLDIPLIANGDIKNPSDAINCLKQTNADGVMIGRAILGSPWKLGEIDCAIKEIKGFKEPNIEEKLMLIIEHLEELIKEKGDHGLLIARKHISWTCKNFSGATKLREKLVRSNDNREVKELINLMIKTLKKEKRILT